MPPPASPVASPPESGAETPQRVEMRDRSTGSTARTAWHLLGFAWGEDATGVGWSVAVAFAGSLAEGAVLVLLLPLLAAAGMVFPGQSVPGRLAAWTQAVLVRSGLPHGWWLPAVLAVFLGAGAVRSVLRRLQMTVTLTTTNSVQLALSRRVYAAVVRAQWVYLVRQRSGRLTHMLTEQLQRVTEAIALGLSLMNLACLTGLYLAFALRLSATVTGLVMGMGVVLLGLQRRAVRRTRTAGFVLNESIGEVFAATEEHLLNLKSVKTYDAEEREIAKFAELCGTVVRQTVETAKHQAGAAFGFEVGSLVALAGVVFVALGVLHVEAATLLVLLAVFTRLMPQMSSLQTQAHQFAVTLPAYDRVLELERECREHAERPESDYGGVELELRREIRVEHVWFAYQQRGGAAGDVESVLRGVTCAIEAGTLTAIAGASGAGKSTLGDVLSGLLTPSRGRVMVDGREIAPGELRQWRRQVGYVGQETVLFHESVRENLVWARPGATEAELKEALRLAAAEFVYGLPEGLETRAGDRGVLLSSGQRQRIALARALLRRPSLLILDEATNALDVENEERILEALREAIRERAGTLTVLMIAHRKSALERADRVIYLDAGRVVAGPELGE